jgi:hypothetical protein
MRWRSEAIDFRLARMRSTRMDIGMTHPSQPTAGCTDGQASSKAKGRENACQRRKNRAPHLLRVDPSRHCAASNGWPASPQMRKKAIACTFHVFAVALEFGLEQVIFPLCAHD